MVTEPLADPWIAAQIEAALAPYLGRLSEEEVAWMRQQLAEILTHDAAAARLLRRARPRDAEVDESGERAYTAPEGDGEPGAPTRTGEASDASGRAKAG